MRCCSSTTTLPLTAAIRAIGGNGASQPHSVAPFAPCMRYLGARFWPLQLTRGGLLHITQHVTELQHHSVRAVRRTIGRMRASTTLVVLVSLFVASMATVSSVVGLGSSAAANPVCTHNWNAASTTGDHVSWGDPNNWTPTSVPGTNALDVACVAAGNAVVMNQNDQYTLTAVSIGGMLTINSGGRLLLDGDPTTAASKIAQLNLNSATLGGTGTVTITVAMNWHSEPFDVNTGIGGAATMTTRDLNVIPPAGTTVTPPSRFGVTAIGTGATLTVDDSAAVGCGDGDASGVNLRDGRRIVNNGTFVMAKCAYVAADWGTLFTNNGTVRLLGAVGYFEGFLGSDLGWPTSPPIFNNKTNAVIRRSTNVGSFTMAAKFANTGSIMIANGTALGILDTVANNVTQLNGTLSRNATGAVGTNRCLPQTVTEPCVAAVVQSEAFQNSADLAATTATVSLQQNANNVGGFYGSTGKRVAGEQLTYTATGGLPTSAAPYIITMSGGPALGSTASQYSVGSNGVVLVACTPIVTTPCLAAAPKIVNGTLIIKVRTTIGSGTVVPLGPRLYR